MGVSCRDFCIAGVAMGIALFQLPWNVVGIILAGPERYYQQQQADLTAAFLRVYESQVQPGKSG